jgi:hypothetical protein
MPPINDDTEPAERSAWTCARCGRVCDFQNAHPDEIQRWNITSAGVLCPGCVTADDLLADSHATFWINTKTYAMHIACACGDDLGTTPASAPADVPCISCGRTWEYFAYEVGRGLRQKLPAASTGTR